MGGIFSFTTEDVDAFALCCSCMQKGEYVIVTVFVLLRTTFYMDLWGVLG